VTSTRPTPNNDGHGDQFPDARSTTSRLKRLTRSSMERFDRYTFDVFIARTPYRAGSQWSNRSA
jgi:hypothetical protein